MLNALVVIERNFVHRNYKFRIITIYAGIKLIVNTTKVLRIRKILTHKPDKYP
jgi:hypothetical protein